MDLSHINSPHFDTAVRYAEDIANKGCLQMRTEFLRAEDF